MEDDVREEDYLSGDSGLLQDIAVVDVMEAMLPSPVVDFDNEGNEVGVFKAVEINFTNLAI